VAINTLSIALAQSSKRLQTTCIAGETFRSVSKRSPLYDPFCKTQIKPVMGFTSNVEADLSFLLVMQTRVVIFLKTKGPSGGRLEGLSLVLCQTTVDPIVRKDGIIGALVRLWYNHISTLYASLSSGSTPVTCRGGHTLNPKGGSLVSLCNVSLIGWESCSIQLLGSIVNLIETHVTKPTELVEVILSLNTIWENTIQERTRCSLFGVEVVLNVIVRIFIDLILRGCGSTYNVLNGKDDDRVPLSLVCSRTLAQSVLERWLARYSHKRISDQLGCDIWEPTCMDTVRASQRDLASSSKNRRGALEFIRFKS